MVAWFKDFLNDKAGFERLARAFIIAGASYAMSEGWISKEVGAILMGGGVLIAAGDKNPKG